MDSYKETFETWNKIASLYQEKFMDLDLYNESYDFICHSIPKANGKLLEIGCGPGNITKYLLSKRPDLDILGIDVAENMIMLAQQNNPEASFQVMDSRKIHGLNSAFDGIICGFCIPYLSSEETEKLISDAHALLNEKGLIYISFVEGGSEQSGYKVNSAGDRVYFFFHSLDTIVKDLQDTGFENIQISRVEFKRSENTKELHTIVTAQK